MPVLDLKEPERLGRTVVLGYCDVSAAGVRVLDGVSGAAESANGLHETSRESLTFLGMGKPVFEGMPALQAVHFAKRTGGDDETEVSFLKINDEVHEELLAPLALAIVDLIGARGSALDRFIVVAAVQSPKRGQMTAATNSAVIPPNSVCIFSFVQSSDDASASTPSLPAAVASLPRLPADARLNDPFLASIVRLCRLEDLPFLLLAREGYRTTGANPDVDGTDEAIRDLGQYLSQTVSLGFSFEKACAVRRSKGVSQAKGVAPGYI